MSVMKRSWLFRCVVVLLTMLLPICCLMDAFGSEAEVPEEILAEVDADGIEAQEPGQTFLTDDDLLIISPDIEALLEGLDETLEDEGVQPEPEALEGVDLLTEAMAEPVDAPETEPDPGSDPGVDSQPAAGDDPEPDPEADSESDPKPDPEPAAGGDPEPDPDPDPESDPKPDPEPAAGGDSEPDLDPDPESDPKPDPEPAAGDDPEPDPDPAPSGDGSETAPEPEPKPDTDLETAAEVPLVAESGSFPSSLVLGLKDTRRLDAGSVLSGRLAYVSSKPSVVGVDADTGRIVAKKKGTAKIAAVNASRKYVVCTVKVVDAPSRIAFARQKLTLNIGSSYSLPAKLPRGTAATVTYASSKAGVAKVNGRGVIQGVKAGTAVITARSHNGRTASCRVTVLNGTAPKTLTLSKTTARVGRGDKLKLKATLDAGSAAVLTWSSSNRNVATVSTKGLVTAKRTGTAKITVRTHNGLKKTCTVKVVKAPSKVSLSSAVLRVAVGETARLTAKLPAGTAASLTWKTGNAAVATVAGGRVTGLKPGTAKITVTTFNGKTASCIALVVADPAAPAEVSGAFEKSSLSVKLGKKAVINGAVTAKNTLLTGVRVTVDGSTATMSAKLSNVASVSLQASACGGAFVVNTAKAPFNRTGTYTLRLYATETTGTAGGAALDTLTVQVTGSNSQRMVDNLRNSSYLGAKATGISGIVELLMDHDYEPAFAAGVAANVLCEGDYGFFESSRYVTYPKNRPRYFAYLDGGNYYALKNGARVLSEVFLSKTALATYTGSVPASLRYSGANFYLNNYSSKSAWNVNLNNLEKLLSNLNKGSWKGMFGLGVVQWTASRTKNLVALYRKHAGDGAAITKSQVIAAENEMILNELGVSYAYVYNGWKSGGSVTGASGAAAAAEIFCRKYEIPAGIEAAVTRRRACAKEIYNIMMS